MEETEYALEKFILDRAESLRLVRDGRLDREAVAWLAREIVGEFVNDGAECESCGSTASELLCGKCWRERRDEDGELACEECGTTFVPKPVCESCRLKQKVST